MFIGQVKRKPKLTNVYKHCLANTKTCLVFNQLKTNPYIANHKYGLYPKNKRRANYENSSCICKIFLW